jgi:hypothetical protein
VRGCGGFGEGIRAASGCVEASRNRVTPCGEFESRYLVVNYSNAAWKYGESEEWRE